MRIAFLVEDFGAIGGVQEVVNNLAAEFSRLGHQIAIFATVFGPPDWDSQERSAMERFEVQIPRHKPATWRHLERFIKPARSVRELAARLRDWHPDVVNSQVWDWDKFQTVAAACRTAGVPLVHTLHDSWGRGSLEDHPLGALKYAAAITCVSAATKQYFETLSRAARKAHVIINGVDCKAAEAAAPYQRARPYILCAARLNLQHKALDALVSGFASIASEYEGVDLLISGDGPDRQQLESQIASLGIGQRVELLGVRPRSELWSLYKGAMMLVMPSRLPEGLGIVFLEAMACGTPVIGTNSGGTPEIVLAGQTGLLLERSEPDEIARAMRTLLDNHDLRTALGRRGRELASTHDWPRVTERYLEVFSSCRPARWTDRALAYARA